MEAGVSTNRNRLSPCLGAGVKIDYERLKWLQTLTSREKDELERQKAHEEFMSHYREVFQSKEVSRKQPICPSNSRRPKTRRSSLPPLRSDDSSSEAARPEIGHYVALIHKRTNTNPYEMKPLQRLKTIRRLLQKLPFERSASENEVLYKHLSYLECITSEVAGPVLEKLSAVVKLETMSGSGFTVYGNHAFYLLLQGSVTALSEPAFLAHDRKPEQSQLLGKTPLPGSEPRILYPGDCFGTLKSVPGRACNSKYLAVVTREPCSFLKISARDHTRVVEQLRVKIHEEKLGVLHTCNLHSMWPKLSLDRAANMIVWKKFKADEVVCHEGQLAPFVGFIQAGECRIQRQVSVLATDSAENTFGNNLVRNVEVGRLVTGEYFGHTSLFHRRPMTSSIVAISTLRLGVILPSDVAKLDEVSQTLLLQSPITGKTELAREEVHKTYVKQELEKEWDTFRKSVVADVISTRGIIPGIGKWQHEV
ncbi:cyclic nucleotide-binding domain-containing protein 1-like isoform X2 [Oscarella lobularis]|uniref:cyclic nucleotide-binding domain-containing protein 1-like isoform X2 n=1 Tax=Oscarella lobularis TaxID=121494 RepID=UPI003313A333